jgi:2-oxoglutarate dehydrogenase E2 component (dihydrolipoamide succinyltransferase)
MTEPLKVPPVGESVTEVVIGDWLVAEGAWVNEDDLVVIIESDKVNMEVPAPKSGRLMRILKATGEDAHIGEVIGHIDTSAEKPADAPAAATATPEAPTPASAAAAPEARVTPAARRMLAEHNLQPHQITATGPGGRLLKEDVIRHLAQPKPAAPAVAAPAARTPGGSRQIERKRLSPMRKTVARRLVEAQQTAALLTTFNEVDLSAVMALRKTHKQAFIDRHGIKLGFMSFFVRAVVEGLRQFPAVNAQIDGDEAIYHDYCDIGVAVGGGRGLVVPVIRNAETLSFAEIEQTIGDLGRRAKANKLKLAELQGGTFSITNGGVYGSLLSTPIVNPPQSGILGMHGIQERPIAVNGEVVIRPMMYIALTYDHRIIDGREAVTFLKLVKDLVENPVRMLLEV